MSSKKDSILQNVFYHYALKNPVIAEKFNPEFFTSKTLQAAFKIAKDYVIKYKQAPTLAQMRELVIINNIQDTIPDDLLSILYSQEQLLASYPDDWLYDEITNYAQYQQIKKTLVDVAAYLKLSEDEVDRGGAKNLVEHAKAMFNKSCCLEFDEDMSGGGSDIFDAEAHKPERLVRWSTGYDFLDKTTRGGICKNLLTIFAAPPKTGKSLVLQNLAVKQVELGKNVCYISLELSEELVLSRIGSNMFSIDSANYEKVAEDTVSMKEKINQYRKSRLIKPGTLIIKDFPTSQLSVLELETWLLNKEESLSTEDRPFKFDTIIIDYVNIMRDAVGGDRSDNTYMKIKRICEGLRGMAGACGWSVISATQTNKESYDSSDVNVSQIAESTGLNATVDVLYAIIADPLMKAMGKYYIKVLLDRLINMENTKKLFNCDWKYLRLTEDPNEGIIDTALENPMATQAKFVKGIAEKRNAKSQQTFQSGSIDKPDAPSPSVLPPNQVFNLIDNPATPVPNNFSSPLFNVKGAGLFDSKPQQ